MNCIFCKTNSDNSKSIEHIIPESLGNKSHTLDIGIVCDKCNNYFATKVEKEVLAQPYFQSLRHRNYILSKKNKLPIQKAFLIQENQHKAIDVENSNSQNLQVIVHDKNLFELINQGKINKLYIPIIPLPEDKNILLSRLIGKIALEALADRIKIVENWNNDFINHKGLDELREYVRYGKGKFWPYNVRKVHDENSNIKKDNEKIIQTIHEYDFLYLENKYLYFICIILGIEYCINIGDRQLEKYEQWLRLNNYESPLTDNMQNKKISAKIF